jgi:hypothetical protein
VSWTFAEFIKSPGACRQMLPRIPAIWPVQNLRTVVLWRLWSGCCCNWNGLPVFENLKSVEKKIEHKTKCTIVFYYRHWFTQTGTPEPFRKKMQTCNRGMVRIVPVRRWQRDHGEKWLAKYVLYMLICTLREIVCGDRVQVGIFVVLKVLPCA